MADKIKLTEFVEALVRDLAKVRGVGDNATVRIAGASITVEDDGDVMLAPGGSDELSLPLDLSRVGMS